MFEHYPLARLIHPIDPEMFFAEYWQKKPLLIRREQPNYYSDLLSVDALEHLLTSVDHQYPDVTIANYTREIKSEAYTFPSGLIDQAKLFGEFASGSSITFNQLHLKHQPLGHLCRCLEQELSIRFQANIYLTPPSGHGFPPHFDSHCVFILQSEGTKHWQLQDTPLQLPDHNQRFDPDTVQVGDVVEEFTLHPGDALYIPRGRAHSAHTEGIDTTSLHITLGAMQNNWSALIMETFARVGLDDPKLRESLPVGFARPDFDRTKARETFKDMIQYALERLDFDQALDVYIDDIISTRHPLLPNGLSQSLQAHSLEDVNREAGVRPNLLFRFSETEEQILLHCYGNEIRFPKHAAEPLRFALQESRFRIADLPGELDDAGKLVLIRRLIKEGIVFLR